MLMHVCMWHKGAIIEIGIYKTGKNNFQLFLAHELLQSEYSAHLYGCFVT